MTTRLQLVFCLLLASASAAPAGDKSQLVSAVLNSLRDDINGSSSGGGHVVKTQSAEESSVSAPGDSSSTAALTSAGSTPNGRETSVSTVLATGEANPGKKGISGTISAVEGGAGTKDGRAGSDGTALIGSIAVENGVISTSTAIVKTKGDTGKGSRTDALGLTSSFGKDGEARGVQYSGSKTGASDKTSTQGDLTIGSSVGNVGTRVSVAGGSQTTRKSPRKPKRRRTIIEEAKRLLAIGYKAKSAPSTKKPAPPTYKPAPPKHKPAPPKSTPPYHKQNPPPPPHKRPPPPKSLAGGDGTIQVDSLTETKISAPGPSSSQSALQSSSRTPGDQQTSTSTVVSQAEADPGRGGLSATMTTTDGGGRLGRRRAGSDATLITGSIAVNEGKISTSTGIVKTSGDTKKGTKTDALGLTSSFSNDGEARGVQQSSASTASSQKSVSQADLTVGSQVGDVGTKISVAGQTTTTKKATTTTTTTPPPLIAAARRRLKDF